MKKIYFLFFVVLFGCTGVDNKNGSENLNKLDYEPVGCDFIYKINTVASVYSEEDAVHMMENQIVEQNMSGDSYFILSTEKLDNGFVVFGPKYTYKIRANVYKCYKY